MYENQQHLAIDVWDVVIEVGGQLAMNNHRNNQKEDMLKALGGNRWFEMRIAAKSNKQLNTARKSNKWNKWAKNER